VQEEIIEHEETHLIERPIWHEPDSFDNARIRIEKLGINMHQHAYLVGKDLIWVKEHLGHGDFIPWIDNNVWFGIKTADRFMEFAKRCDKEKYLLEYHPRKEQNGHHDQFEPKVYDVWNFSECDDRFGIEYPGRIPGQIIQNILYYYTEENDIILDPMAGGGVTHDVCKEMNRKCYSYDINPKRDFIKKNDITNGFPNGIKNISLVILDPPYFKKKEEEYGENSISALDREQYLNAIEKIAENCKGKRIALIMGKYYDYDNPQESIFLSDYVNIFEQKGFKQTNEISINQTPPQGGQYAVEQAKIKKQMEIIKRDLVIFDWDGKNG